MIQAYNPQDRYRRKRFGRFTTFFFAALMFGVGAAAGAFYNMNQKGFQDLNYEEMINILESERIDLQSKLSEMSARTKTAERKFADLQDSINSKEHLTIPNDLYALIQQSLDSGIDPDRLRFVIQSARPPTNCTDPESAIFIVRTPNYEGPVSEIEIKDTGIKISGSGASTINENGDKESWFDPLKPMRLFVSAGPGSEKSKEAILPFQESYIYNGREYRFTMTEGGQSYAKVTYDSCDYP